MSKIYFHADDFGRSKEVSKNIMKCLVDGNLNSVSIMVNHMSDKHHLKLKRMKDINKRLHLNLTEIPKRDLQKNSFLKKLSFIKLLFLNNAKKKIIYREINSQIEKYQEIYKPKKLKIDGHEHVHMIPWILKHLRKVQKKYNIKELRNSNESLMIPRLIDLINFRYFRNIIACLVIKVLYNFQGSPRLTSNKFFGIIHSGIQTEETITNILGNFKKNKKINLEILVHPGFTNRKERKNFKKEYFNFYNSKNRKIEYDLCFFKNIKTEIARSL